MVLLRIVAPWVMFTDRYKADPPPECPWIVFPDKVELSTVRVPCQTPIPPPRPAATLPENVDARIATVAPIASTQRPPPCKADLLFDTTVRSIVRFPAPDM